MASKVEICNRALQLLGAKTITSLTDNSSNAARCNLAYEPIKLAMLRSHTWSCAVKRAQLSADSTAPLFGKTRAFTLPADFVRLLPLDPEDVNNDDERQIEGRKIVSNESAPMDVRYIYDVTDPNEMDALFREVLSHNLAWNLCEDITNSNSKKDAIERGMEKVMAQARRANAIERASSKPPEDEWVTKRL